MFKRLQHRICGARLCGVVASVAVSTLVSSCIAVGPDYEAPAPPQVDRYTRASLPGTTGALGATGGAQHFAYGRDLPEPWWRLFRSPGLNRLVEEALHNNQNLQATMSTLRAAKEVVHAQQAKYFPAAQANFNSTRQQISGATPGFAPVPVPANGPFAFDLYTSQVLVSYSMDVWGLNRRTVEAQQALADEQRFTVEAAYLTLTSNVVVAAIQEASLRGQIDATIKIIALNKKALDILRQQFNAGYASRIDLAAQEAILAQEEATLPPLQKQLAITRDLLTALLGRYPSEEPFQTFNLESLQLPQDLPVSLPSQLIEQRPDVRLAEEQMHSASALVGVATANMLPNFTINANGGYTALTLAGLLHPFNAFWLLSSNVTQTIFDAGNLLHLRREAEATYDQTGWTYRSVLIGALQNVADSLHALQYDAAALKAARDFERAAKISLDLSRQQLEVGQANVLFLLLAQQTYLTATIGVVQARANRLSDTAALFQSLGGGWWNRVEPPDEKILDVGSNTAFSLVDPHVLIDPHGLY
jgi:NodT family efflux transporter outer membrane factor (OMF) lipoprotein